MKWFPWQSNNMEHRADSSYTDALIAAITANAKGQTTAFPCGDWGVRGRQPGW